MSLEVGAGGAGGWGENDDKAMKGIMYLSAIKKNAQRTSQKTRLHKYLLLVGVNKIYGVIRIIVSSNLYRVLNTSN